LTKDGWLFTGRDGSDKVDPLYGFTKLSQLYKKADPEYVGRFTVPALWDKKRQTIVNNESSEIIRILYSEFDDLLPANLRESNKPGGGFYPEHLRKEIDEMNEWVYNTINNGVYKTGFATTQTAYESNLFPLFESLDRLEKHLGELGHTPYLFGDHLTEADIRLYTTLIRFDVAYVNIFKCNLKMIRYDYPLLYQWLRYLYWDGGNILNGDTFKKTTYFDIVSTRIPLGNSQSS
jgi:glutathionyl-hydroquinone reductase